MYMNCAVVTITGGSGSGLSALPDMFVANIGNGCSSNAEGTGDLEFPNPGDDVTNNSSKSSPPTGTCAGGAGSGGSGGSGGSSGDTDASTPTSSIAPTVTGGAGSGDSNGDASPTQTFDDGLYHPTTAVVDVTDVAPTETGAPSASADAGDAYDIVMVIDGETRTGLAYLTKPTPAARHRYHRRAHKFYA
jgi:hypothetical protein